MRTPTQTYAPVTSFNEETGEIDTVGQVQYWPVIKQEDQPVSGITFLLDEERDLTISDEMLAEMGYVKA